MFDALTILVVLVLNALMGTTVFLRNPRAATNVFFGAFVLFVDLWLIANYLQNEPSMIGIAYTELFLRIDFVVALFLFWAWFRFAYALSGVTLPTVASGRVDVAIVSTISLLGWAALFTDTIVARSAFVGEVITFDTGPLFVPYALIVIALAVLGLLLLAIGLRGARQRGDRLRVYQLALTFVGTAISIVIAVSINFLQPFLDIGLDSSRLGIYSLLVMVAFITYAMARYRFFDLKLVIVRSVAFLVLVGGIVGAYITVSFLFVERATGITKEPVQHAVDAIIAILAAISFHPLYRFVSTVTARFVYKRYYDIDVVLGRVAEVLVGSLETRVVLPHVMEIVIDTVGCRHATILLLENKTVLEAVTYPDTEEGLVGSAHDLDMLSNALTQASRNAEGTVASVDDVHDGGLRDALRTQAVAAVLVLRLKGEAIGYLSLSEKRSGEHYSARDIEFLRRLGPELSIGIQNLRSYEAVRELSVSLEEKVEERTRELVRAQEREIEKARDIARLKDEFVYIATHELRAPITAIRIFLELIRDRGDALPDEVYKHLQSIEDASLNLNQLIDDLLEIARSESGTLHIAVRPTKLDTVLREVVDQQGEYANQHQVTVGMKVKDTCPMVMADPDKLREVVTNLLTNAIKYNREGGTVDISAVPVAEHVVVEFRDTGFGIPKDQGGKVFDKFFRVSREETAYVQGTGLGLFITRMLVQKMGGTIEFISTDKKGTTFAFTLPRAAA